MLFPDGTRRPFDELVRSSLTCGQIKASRPLLHDGAAEYALKNGAPRGTKWRCNRMDLDPYTCRLAWFEDPRGMRSRNPSHCDSVHLDCTPCAVYVNRVDTMQLALSFGSQLLLLKAASQEDAYDWATVLASTIFFSSDSFKALVDECAQCFAIAVALRSERLHVGMQHRGKDAQLSLEETTALLRVMLRPLGYNDIRVLESRLAPSGSGLGVEAFTRLFRHMASDDNPLDELARALTILSATHSKTVPAIDATPDLPLGDTMFEELKKQDIPKYIVELLLDAADAVAYDASPDGPAQPVAPLQVAQVLYPRTAGLTAGDHFVFDHAETPIGYRTDAVPTSPKSADGNEVEGAVELEANVVTEEEEEEAATVVPDSVPGDINAEIDAELRSRETQEEAPPAKEPTGIDSFVDQLRNMWGSFMGGAAEPEPAPKNKLVAGGSDEKFFDSDGEGGPTGPTPRTYKGRLDRARSGKPNGGKGDGSDEKFFESDEDAEPGGPTPRTYASRVDRARAGKLAGGGAAGGSDDNFFGSDEEQAGSDGPTPRTYESRMDRARSRNAGKAAGGGGSDENFFGSDDEQAGPGGPTPGTYGGRMDRARSNKAAKAANGGGSDEKFFDSPEGVYGPDGPTPRTYGARVDRARSGNALKRDDTTDDIGAADYDSPDDRAMLIPEGGTLRSRYIGADLAAQAAELRAEQGPGPHTYQARLARARAGRADRDEGRWDDAGIPDFGPMAPTPRTYQGRLERARVRKLDSKSAGRTAESNSPDVRVSGAYSPSPDGQGGDQTFVPVGATLRSRYIGEDLASQARELRTDNGSVSPRTYEARVKRARAGSKRANATATAASRMVSAPVGGTLRSQYIGIDLAAQVAERKTEPPITPRTYSGRIQRARAGLSAKDLAAVALPQPAAVERETEPAGEKTDAFQLTLPRANARVIGAMPAARLPRGYGPTAPLRIARI